MEKLAFFLALQVPNGNEACFGMLDSRSLVTKQKTAIIKVNIVYMCD
jgi:hypothetical protein